MISLWRQHWADRENARLQAEYDRAALAWQHDLEQIRRYHRLSITAGPVINTTGIRLQHGENLWWTTTGAKLVEMPQTIQLVDPDHSAYSPTNAGAPVLPRGTLRDNGFVAITNQRVLFLGSLGGYEWCFPQLTGVAYGLRETVMRVEDRPIVCGLGVAPAAAPHLRFHLALALAEHHDDREGFTDHLARLLDRYQFQGPRVPGPADPGRAPHPWRLALRLGRRLYFGQPGASAARQVVPALATAVLFACGLGLATMPVLDPDTGAGLHLPPQGGGIVAAPSATAFGTPVGMPVGPLGPDTPQKDSPPRQGAQAIQPSTPKPEQPPPSSGPPPVNLCGAPPNPWNFHFCEAGSLIEDPPAAFCSHFPCTETFWRHANGLNGFVVQCRNGLFSRTGGRPGACAQHGGPGRALRR